MALLKHILKHNWREPKFVAVYASDPELKAEIEMLLGRDGPRGIVRFARADLDAAILAMVLEGIEHGEYVKASEKLREVQHLADLLEYQERCRARTEHAVEGTICV